MTMLTFVIKRLASAIPLLLGITVISFAVIHAAPGKPAAVEQALNPRVSRDVILRLEKLYGLDKPLHVQYLAWLKRIVRLDFGRSFIDDRPVSAKILERVPVTLCINILSLLIVLALGIPLGVRCAVKEGSFFDGAIGFIAFLGFAAPTFWLALLLMNFLSVHLGWFPVSGLKSLDYDYFPLWRKALDLASHLFLPVCVSAFTSLAGIMRYMRANMIDVLRSPFMIAARAKGLPEGEVLYRHGLRNAVLPIVTILGLSVPGLLGGSVIFESIFAIPGIGQLFFEAVMSRDYPLIMAEVVLGGVLTMLGNMLADIAYAFVDPRIRYNS